jgi:hypothetical protein
LNPTQESGREAVSEAGETHRPAAGVHPRWWAAAVLAACTTVLGLSAYLKPDPRGYGTHAQLGTGQCGILIVTGYPCPTCGMTTAFAHAVRGQWWRSFLAQPGGFVMAVATMVLAVVSAWTLIRGRWPAVRLPWVTPFRLLMGFLVLLLGSWAFKIVLGLALGTLPRS